MLKQPSLLINKSSKKSHYHSACRRTDELASFFEWDIDEMMIITCTMCVSDDGYCA